MVTEYEYGMAKYQAENLPHLIAEMERTLEQNPDDRLTAEKLARTRQHLQGVQDTIAAYEGGRTDA